MRLSKKFAEWEEEAPKDFDPEGNPESDSDGESGSEEENDKIAETEHYVSVGKSKLRQKETVSLGPQYRGARVSRQVLEDDEDSDGSDDNFEDARETYGADGTDDESEEEFDDPDNIDLAADQARADDDAEISSDNAFGESDDEKFEGFVFRGSSNPRQSAESKRNRRPTASDFISSSEAEQDGSSSQDDEDSGSEDAAETGGADILDLEASESDEGASLGTEEEDEEDEDTDDGGSLDGFIAGDSESEEQTNEDTEDDSDDEEKEEVFSEPDRSSKRRAKETPADARAEQRLLMKEAQKSLMATVSAAAQKDTQKGLAVRQQRKTFDGLLNIRIRLQKALVATNSFSALENDGEEEHDATAYEAAEQAALKLLDTLEDVRGSLLQRLPGGGAGEKRKRDSDEEVSSTAALWGNLQDMDQRAAKYRKKVLETWSNKTKSATVEVKRRNLVSTQQSIISSLQEQLLNSERLVKRTRTPRSCAPVQVARKVNEDAAIYDDADFYQQMLKELVDQRTTDGTSTQANNGSLTTVRWAAIKEAKTRKHVDRRASKGRKMRFNIHEKLQNFMAPEDRRSWEQDAIDRLFGTLFGQKMELGEGPGSDEEMDDVNAEEEGLRLFRS